MSVKLRERKLNNNCKSFYLDVYFNGRRSYEFLQVKINPKEDNTSEKRKQKIELAQAIRSQREIELISKGTPFIPKHRRNLNFLEYYKNYLANYPKKDVRMIKYSLEKFSDFIKVDRLLVSDLTPKLCEDFRDYLASSSAKLSGETPQNYFTRFKKVLRAATKAGILKENPALDIQFKNSDAADKLRKEILTENELNTLATTYCGNNEVKRSFLFACFSGLGIAEIRKLKWSHLNNDRLKIYREKTGTEINIPLSITAKKLIGKRKKADENVFDVNISDKAISKDLKNWVGKAEIEKNISFYCGRHTYAVQLLLNGANLKTVSDCMGHKNTRHTLKYLNYVDSLKDAAIDNLPTLKMMTNGKKRKQLLKVKYQQNSDTGWSKLSKF